MIDKIVAMIVEQSKQTQGQNVAARLHSVLMDVGDAVGKIIVQEQQKERAQGGIPEGTPGKNACQC